jgi:hypothetical protein
LAFTPHVKALELISEFQPMRSTDFDNLKQQNGLDSSCKAALRIATLCEGRRLVVVAITWFYKVRELKVGFWQQGEDYSSSHT